MKIKQSEILPKVKVLNSAASKKDGTIYEMINISNKMSAGSRSLIVSIPIDLGLGDVCVNASKLTSVISSFKPSDVLDISLDKDEFLIIKSGRKRFKIASSKDAYPSIEFDDKKKKLNISGIDFIKKIKKAAYAVNINDVRHYLRGVCLDGGFVATDGHRLCAINCGDFDADTRSIIPMQFISSLSGYLGDGDVFITPKHVVFESSDIEVVSSTIDGKFPDWRRVVPENRGKITVLKDDIVDALSSCMAISDNNLFSLKCKNNEISVEAVTNRSESGAMSIECNGVDFESGVNGAYMISMLKSLECESVDIMVGDSSSPIRIDDGNSTHVVMPIRL